MRKFIFKAIVNSFISESVKMLLPLIKNIVFFAASVFFCLTILPFLNSTSEMASDIFSGRPIFWKCIGIFCTTIFLTVYFFRKQIHYTFAGKDSIAEVFGCLTLGFAIAFLLYVSTIPAAYSYADELKNSVCKIEETCSQDMVESLKSQCASIKTFQEYMNVLVQLKEMESR